MHIRNLRQAFNHGLVLKKVPGVIKFNQNAWLKPYIDMNSDLRKKAKKDFQKDYFKLMNNAVFGKTMENVRKLVTTKKRRNYLVSELIYHTTKFFTENLLVIEMKAREILLNKPVYLGISILELSKILLYVFWYDYVKPKYSEKTKLCYMHADSFIVYIKADDIYKDISGDVETRFDTSNYELDHCVKEKIKKVIGLMKNELGGKIMAKFVGLRAKSHSYLIVDGSEDKKGKDTKKCVIKRKLTFENCKNCLEATKLEKKIKHLEKLKLK